MNMRAPRKPLWITAAAILILLIVGASIWAVRSSQLSSSNEGDASGNVETLALFSLKGCGSCTDALEVMKQIEGEYPDYRYEYFSIIDDTEAVNRYGVTEHPSLIFLTGDDRELGRINKKFTPEDVASKLEEIRSAGGSLEAQAGQPSSGSVSTGEGDAAAPQTPVQLTLYALDSETHAFTPVTQYFHSKTNVRYPKVSALRMLAELSDKLPASLHSAIPEQVSFVEIRSDGSETIVELSEEFNAFAGSDEGTRAEQAIALTLHHFEDVDGVRIVTNSYRSDLIASRELTSLIGERNEFVAASSDVLERMTSTELYNAAVLHSHDLEFLPCYCGCGDAGHHSNRDCYFSRSDDGRLTPTLHAEFCQVCLDITHQYLDARDQGNSLPDIRRAIEDTYKGAVPTNTPTPLG